MHIFQRDRIMQLIKCTPWSTRLCPHPTIIKRMKTFLEAEGKMGQIFQPTSQYRTPQLNTSPKIIKDNAEEKRKRAAPTKKFRPSTSPKSSETDMCPTATISKAQVNDNPQTEAPENRLPPLESAPVHESTPWPSAGRMSGNLFKDRNWLLPPSYLNNDSKIATGITRPKLSIKEESKIGEQSNIRPKIDKCGWGPNCAFCKNQDKEDWDGKHQNLLQQKMSPQPKCRYPKQDASQNCRSLIKKHQTSIQVRQKFTNNGRQKWKD